MLEKIFNFLSTLKLAIVLCVSGVVFEILLSIWGAFALPEKVAKIGKLSPFIILWTCLLLNTFFCILKRMNGYLNEARKKPLFLPSNYDLKEEFEKIPITLQKRIKKDLIVKNRFYSLGSILVHFSLILIGLSLLLSYFYRYEGKFTLGIKEESSITERSFEKFSPPFMLLSTPSFNIRNEDVVVEFWGSELLFTRYKSKVNIDGKVGTTAINSPIFLSLFSAIRLSSFGYGLHYIVIEEGKNLPVEEGVVKLNIFPPGSEDNIRLENFPHRIYVKFYPDFEQKDGRFSSKSMNLLNPRVVADVYRGKVYLGRRVVKFGEPIKVEGITLSFLNALPTSEFTYVFDPGFIFLMLSFTIGIYGLFLKLKGKRKELMVIEENGKKMVILKNWDLK